jgi:hypothetical protein
MNGRSIQLSMGGRYPFWHLEQVVRIRNAGKKRAACSFWSRLQVIPAGLVVVLFWVSTRLPCQATGRSRSLLFGSGLNKILLGDQAYGPSFGVSRTCVRGKPIRLLFRSLPAC